MNKEKHIVVREFDLITNNPDYKDSPEYAYLDNKTFSELKQFIHAYAANEENADALDFFKEGYSRRLHDYIQVKNYVGLIQLDSGFQIQILPKINLSTGEDASNSETMQIFMRMLKCMKDFPGKVFNTASLNTDKMDLYEVFISMYLRQVRELTKRGLKSAYQRVEDNLTYYKGKLLVSKQLKKNLSHEERFYVQFDEFNLNRAENRLIKATLCKLQKISNTQENIKAIRQLLPYFEQVDVSTNYSKDFANVIIDRNTKEYESLMVWSKVFLLDKNFTTFSGDTSAKALLFPMEKVFEAYVAKMMKQTLSEKGCEVSAQDRGYYLFELEERQIFALRPDIVITCPDGHKIIMDTKWKRLINNPKKNYGISQGDMYQMYAYAKKYETQEYGIPEIWLLYPRTEDMQESFEFTSNDGVYVHVYFIDLADVDAFERMREILVI